MDAFQAVGMRKRAYMLAFTTWTRLVFPWWKRARRAIRTVFSQPAGQAVLIDLAQFCRANEPCWDADPRKHAVLEGRREVWLRIQQHLNLSEQQLVSLYTGRGFNPYAAEEAEDE